MADDNLVPRSQVPAFDVVDGTVVLVDRSDLAKVVVKGAPGSNLAVQLAGVRPGRSVLRGSVRIGRVRPDEWLYLGPSLTVAVAVAELDLTGHTAVTDVTHGRAAISIGGPDARMLLERTCSLDLSDLMFPVDGMATARVVEVRCDLIRVAEWEYLIVFDRSYAEYVASALAELQTEFR